MNADIRTRSRIKGFELMVGPVVLAIWLLNGEYSDPKNFVFKSPDCGYREWVVRILLRKVVSASHAISVASEGIPSGRVLGAGTAR